MQGYWRSSEKSENFIQCRIPESCLGRNGTNSTEALTGLCAYGYRGILCNDCI